MVIQERSFSVKLNAALKLTELSNSSASKLFNIDPSYVSRLRNGTRIPKTDSELISGIAKKLGEVMWRKGLAEPASSLMKRYPVPTKKKLFYQAVLEWLTDFDEEEETDAMAMIMDAINEYSLPDLSQQPSAKDIINELHFSNKLEYDGIRGLQEASTRFLVEAYQEKAPQLKLYSDQNISWMAENPKYHRTWKHLMAACLHQGVKIKIIHYIRRNYAELLNGLLSWLPLYFMGEIESYCRYEPTEPAFSHTIFLHDDHACVEGMTVRGNEKMGRYRYGTTKTDLERCNSSFNLLLADSAHFISSVKGIHPLERLTGSTSKKMLLCQGTLPLETMSEELFREILKNNSIFEEEIQILMKEFFAAKETLTNLCQKKEVALTTFRESAIQKQYLPVDTEPFTSEIHLTCTREQWEQHLSETQAFFKARDGFFHLVDNSFLAKIHIFTAEDIVYIKHMSLPDKVFFYSHPYMVDATKTILSRATAGEQD